MTDNKGSANRRNWVVARGKVTINVTEFIGVIPRFSYQLGRMNHEAKFVPFINHEMVDDVFTVLREVVEANGAAIKRAEEKRTADMVAHKERQDKNLGKDGRKKLERMGQMPKTVDLRKADRRSEKEKEKNQRAWPGHMLTADRVPAALRELEGQAEPMLVIHPGKE